MPRAQDAAERSQETARSLATRWQGNLPKNSFLSLLCPLLEHSGAHVLTVCRHLHRGERQSERSLHGFVARLGCGNQMKEATVTMRVPKSMIFCALAVSGLLLVLFTTCPVQESHLVANEANPRFANPQSNEGQRSELPQNTLQTARIIGVESDIE